MTERREAIERLIVAVKKGSSRLAVECLAAEIWDPEKLGEPRLIHLVGRSHQGSLDAAEALHNELVPDHGLELAINDGFASTLVFPDAYRHEYGGDDCCTNKVTSRAWLLSLLYDALASEEGGAA